MNALIIIIKLMPQLVTDVFTHANLAMEEVYVKHAQLQEYIILDFAIAMLNIMMMDLVLIVWHAIIHVKLVQTFQHVLLVQQIYLDNLI